MMTCVLAVRSPGTVLLLAVLGSARRGAGRGLERQQQCSARSAARR